MKHHFYDIESLENVFTLCNFKPEENLLDVFYLIDDKSIVSDADIPLIARHIMEKNHNFNGCIDFYNLDNEEAFEHLAKTFGLSDAVQAADPRNKSNYPDAFRLTPDTDLDYDKEKHPYLLGYNSYNYDSTMLAMYFYEGYDTDARTTRPVKASLMREYNDDLFTSMFIDYMPGRLLQTYDSQKRYWSARNYNDPRHLIRQNMMLSGRHVDVARLNEAQSRVGLKRLMGFLGLQILESDKLEKGRIDTLEDFCDLIAYNTSDVINLHVLFQHDVYSSAFELKLGLLETYPELIYNQVAQDPTKSAQDNYKPDISPYTVRRKNPADSNSSDRLCIDSSSAKFATLTLCPYGHLTDIPAVSFDYPSKRKAEELGIPQVNVLEEAKNFFYQHFRQPALRQQFDKIYRYYKSIEGKNFNNSKNYEVDYGSQALPVYTLSNIPKDDNCLPYFDKEGQPTSCFVTFSTGGIHGAEYNKNLFEYLEQVWKRDHSDMTYVKSIFPDPKDLKTAKRVNFLNGTSRPAGDFIKSGKLEYKDVDSRRPVLFVKEDNNATKLHPKFVYTSYGLVNHEDFKSYYPNLLRMMEAFYNKDLGYDRYGEIAVQKDTFDVKRKDPSYTKEERSRFNTSREGVKLILNSASGAGDTNFESSIRVNNQIISMRIIGQLFSWRIGQAQTIEGARIFSTNTDGLYSHMEEQLNNLILARESQIINVEIEPEPMFLVSKDTNNRVELSSDGSKVISVSGGSVVCADGPTPRKSLTVPAVIHWALREYLIKAGFETDDCAMHKPFNRDVGRDILHSTKTKWDAVKWLNMFQNIVASSNGSISYIFGTRTDDTSRIQVMQHYNRVFIMKQDTPNTLYLQMAHAKSITPATISKRKRDKERAIQHDPEAKRILALYNIIAIENGKEAAIKKVTNIEPEWFMRVENRALAGLSDQEQQELIEAIDMEKYLDLLENSFEKNWRNEMPPQVAQVLEKTKPNRLGDLDMFIGITTTGIDRKHALTVDIDDLSTKEKLYKEYFDVTKKQS